MRNQWLTEHKYRPGRRPQMPPFREKILVRPKKSQRIVPSCQPLLTCAAPNFHLFWPFFTENLIFSRKFSHFYVNFHIFSESAAPSEVPPGATRSLCPPSVHHSAQLRASHRIS